MQNKKKNCKEFSIKDVSVITVITCFVSFFVAFNMKKTNNQIEMDEYSQELLENYNYILHNSINNVSGEELVSKAISGMVNSLDDQYANYISKEDIDNFNVLINGEYEGLGIEITYNEYGAAIINNVFDNSPAQKQGLQKGDIIISINGESMLGKSLDEIKNYIHDFNNEGFELGYKRGDEEKEAKLKVENIIIESVSTKIYSENENTIGYIKLNNFASNSYEQFRSGVESLERENIDSLIIDLRYNTGGQLNIADNIISMFIEHGKTIYQLKEKNEIIKYKDISDESRNYEIVVLVNHDSASASELVAGALKEVYGAKIVGTNTYGKGTAQKVITLANGEQYKLTTSEWLTANGNSIDKVGIQPDMSIEISSDYINNPIEENDNQLKKALEILSK